MVLDITGIDIGALIAGLGGLAKSLHSDRKAAKAEDQARSIVADREQTKQERDREIENIKTEVALLKAFKDDAEKRLLDGNNHFVRLEGEVKETNGLLREIIGALRNSGFLISKSPKLSRDSGFEL